ncbi:hypothetical protein L7F22_050003 [Adiantum nelumboides]|nr:hypothetical protein [Adiantum nelumboides]
MSKSAPELAEIAACFHIQQLCFASNYATEESDKLHVTLTCEQTGQVSHLFVSRKNWAVYYQLSRILKMRGLKNVCFGSWSAIPNVNEVGDFLKHEPCCYLYERSTEPPLKPVIPDSWNLIVNLLFAVLNQLINSSIYYYIYGSLIVTVFVYSLYRAWHSTFRKQIFFNLLSALQSSLGDCLFRKLKCLHTCDPMTHKLWKPSGLRRKFVVTSYVRHEYSSNENRFYAPKVIASIADYNKDVIEHFESKLHRDGQFEVKVFISNIGPNKNLVVIDSTLYHSSKRQVELTNKSAYCVKKLVEWCKGSIPDSIQTYHWWMNNVHAKDFADLVSDSTTSDFTGYGICIARTRALISPWVS